jgi:hypothetical protein
MNSAIYLFLFLNFFHLMADYRFLWFLNSSELCFFFFFFGFSIPFKVFEEKLEPNEECDISNM